MRLKKIKILIALVFIFSLITVIWWRNGIEAVNKQGQDAKIFVIESGQGVRQISNNLKKEGLIKDQVVFFLYARLTGIDKKIQAGSFRLSTSMNASEVANAITHGTLDIWITIPEGKRATEIAQALKENIPTYETLWDTELVKNEGYLFPDTYLIPKDADINMIISIFTNNFEKKFETLDLSNTSLTKNEIVTIASMIEREAKNDNDRVMVASVILNRLNIGMKLDIDATVQYAIGYQPSQERWWKQGLTLNDLQINSPYNTYVNAGTPPGPISNPGLASMRAVLSPSESNYLFYITDKNGINRYAEDLEGHNENIRRYGLSL